MSEVPVEQRWRILITPRWLGWHVFAVLAFIGMLWLGDWQLHRALAGNSLSWAYTFEWPIFAVFGVVFWTKTVRDELHPKPEADGEPEEISLPAGARWPGAQAAGSAGAVPASAGQQGAAFSEAGEHASGDDAGTVGSTADVDSTAPQDAELAEYNAYLAKLNAEVKRHGRWHGLR